MRVHPASRGIRCFARRCFALTLLFSSSRANGARGARSPSPSPQSPSHGGSSPTPSYDVRGPWTARYRMRALTSSQSMVSRDGDSLAEQEVRTPPFWVARGPRADPYSQPEPLSYGYCPFRFARAASHS